ncbi:MAG: succinylglutamate desuccinylase/aspartoacylase family protein [Gammaproteobacteria bacterium]
MQSNSDRLSIYGYDIKPGDRTVIMLPMPKLYNWSPLNMPVHVIRSKKPGPVLCVTAAIHGDEVNGIEIIRKLLKKKLLRKLSGTLIAVPIVNIFGFLYQDRYLMDRRDLNRSFPGSTKGSLAGRLANLVATELLSNATHVIDLHSGSMHRTNLPQIRTNLDITSTKDLACAFNAPVALHATERDGSMRQYASEQNIACLLYEGGEALRFDEFSIRTGLNGILNVMRYLKMLPEPLFPIKKIIPTLARTSYWIRSPFSGILRRTQALGKKINKGDILAIIANPTNEEEHKLLSPTEGIIIGKSNLALVHEGAALFHVACFKELTQAAEQIEYLQKFYGEYD